MNDRMRQHRARKAAGLTVLRVAVNVPVLTEVLIDAGWLGAWDQDDPEAIRDAIERVLARLTPADLPQGYT